jgi:putative transcriptional regulator
MNMKKLHQNKLLVNISLSVAALCFIVSIVILIGAGTSGGYAPFLQKNIVDRIPSQDRGYSDVKLSKGKFLVASRGMADPRFKETVILLIKYDKGGAMGLVINRPSEVKLHTVFPELKGLQKRNDTVFMGGPVAGNQMVMLMRIANLPEESLQVFQNVYVSSSMAVLKRLALEGRETFRVYDGYSGWAPGQLEWELSRGDWHIMTADAEAVFDKDPLDVWHELILKSSAIHVIRVKERRSIS